MGNHEFCTNCGQSDFHEGEPCNPIDVCEYQTKHAEVEGTGFCRCTHVMFDRKADFNLAKHCGSYACEIETPHNHKQAVSDWGFSEHLVVLPKEKPMPTDNHMHRFTVELSHYDYTNIEEALDGTVADEIAQVIIEYLPALKVKVNEGAQVECDVCGKLMNRICRACGNEIEHEG